MNEAMLHIVASAEETTLADVPPSVLKILRGALMEIAARGSRRMTMSDISERSGVSRGTLYRYFSTKDQVLAAVSEYVSVTFEQGVRAVAAAHADPIERLRAVMAYHASYTGEQTPENMVEVEPVFVTQFFRTHFSRHKAALLDALMASFDAFDAQLGRPLDRGALVEHMIRIQLSRLLVPADGRFSDVWNAVPEIILDWMDRLSSSRPH